MVPATIFDFNGVLADDEPVHRDAFREVLGPLGVTFSDTAYVERYLGIDDIGALRLMMEDAGRAATYADVVVARIADLGGAIMDDLYRRHADVHA